MKNIISKIKNFANTYALTALVALCAVLVTVVVMRFQLVSAMPEDDSTQVVTHERYIVYGRYYLDGSFIDNNGDCWIFTTQSISDKEPYDNEPVYAVLDNNNTPDDITDDIILGMVEDINTAIYDTLEDELSQAFELERVENNIRIIAHK